MFDKNTELRCITEGDKIEKISVIGEFFKDSRHIVCTGIIPESIMYSVYWPTKTDELYTGSSKAGPMPQPAYFISQLTSENPVDLAEIYLEDQESGEQFSVKCTLNQRFLAARQVITPSHKRVTEFYTISVIEYLNNPEIDVWLVRLHADGTKTMTNISAAKYLDKAIAYGIFTNNDYLVLDNGLIAERSMDYPW